MDLGQLIVQIIADTSGLTAGITDARAQMDSLSGAATQAGAATSAGLDGAAASATGAGQAIADTATAAAGAAASTSAATQAAGAAVAGVGSKTSAASKEAAKAIADLGENASKVGMAMSIGLSAPIAILGGVGVKSAADFGNAMELIHTQAGASQQEVNSLSGAVVRMSEGTTQGPMDLAQGLFHLESVGLRGANAMSVLHVATEGAAAGQANLEDVTNALASAMVTHIQGAQNATQAMSILNATVGAGNMRMGDLAAAMSSGVLPAAQEFGVSLSEVGAALATLTDAGVPAQDAGTRLRMLWSQIGAMGSNAKATKTLESFGMTTQQLAQDIRGPDGVVVALADMKAHMENAGLSQTGQNTAIASMFGGGRSSSAVITLMDNLQRMQGKFIAINDNAANFAQDVSAALSTPAARFAELKSSAEAAAIGLGNALMPAAMTLLDVLTPLIDTVANVANWFATLPAPVRDAAAGFALLIAAIGPMLWIGGQVANTWKSLRDLWTGITALMGRLTSATQAQVVATQAEADASGAAAAETQAEADAMTAEAAAASEAAPATQALADATDALDVAGVSAAPEVAAVGVAADGEAVAAGLAGAATMVFGAALELLTSPVTLIIAAIVALALVAALVVANWRVIGAFFTDLWNEIERLFVDGANHVIDALNFMTKPLNATIGLFDRLTGAKIGSVGTVGHLTAPAQTHAVAAAQAWNAAHHHLGGIAGAKADVGKVLGTVGSLVGHLFGGHGATSSTNVHALIAHSKALLDNAKAAQAGADALKKMQDAAKNVNGLTDSVAGLGKAAKSTKAATDALLQAQLAGMTEITNAGLVAARQVYTHAAAVHNSQAEDTAKVIMDLAQGMARDPFAVQSTKHTLSGEAKVTHHHSGSIHLTGGGVMSQGHVSAVADVIAKHAHSQQFRFAAAPSPRRTFK